MFRETTFSQRTFFALELGGVLSLHAANRRDRQRGQAFILFIAGAQAITKSVSGYSVGWFFFAFFPLMLSSRSHPLLTEPDPCTGISSSLSGTGFRGPRRSPPGGLRRTGSGSARALKLSV
jgi:hypothetical protein